MKKWMIAALLISLALLIAAVILLIVIGGGANSSAAEESVDDTATGIVNYTKEHWPGYDNVTYDPASGVLTLSKKTSMDYDTACAYGGSGYEPETYRQIAAMIALDVAAQCSSPSLSATLCFLSTDGKPIFTVGSGGEIWTCWETSEP